MAATTTQPFIPCDDACMFAKGTDCECPCGGDNHQVGTKGLIPANYMMVTRTTAGRLINPVFADRTDQEKAEWALAREDEGLTRRAIAKELGVSASTVRRYITRLLLAEDQAAEAGYVPQDEQFAA